MPAQRMDWSIPEAIGPHAVLTAVRSASVESFPEAFAQFSVPLKLTQAEHSTACAESVL